MQTSVLIGMLFFMVVALLIVVVVALLRKPHGSTDVSLPLQQLNQAMSSMQVELRGVSERVSSVEQNQNVASQNIFAIGTGLTETGTITKNIVDTTAAIRDELSRAKNDLTELQTHTKARQALEQQTADSIRRLEAVIAGTQTKGAAGENIVEVVFSKLPTEWQVRNLRIGDKAVEFGLRLPNNLVLPIDSKWAATNLLEQLSESQDPAEQLKLKSQIESAVIARTKEVKKYIDPNITVNFAIATVPDAIYDLCSSIQTDVFQMNVVLVSYSMLVPYLLLVFQTVLRTCQNIDLQRLEAYLSNAQSSIKAVQDELEGRFSRGLTMLSNARDDMAINLSKASSGLTSIQVSTAAQVEETIDTPALESINQ